MHHIEELFSLKNKVVLISGGAGFLGRVFAKAVSEAGASVVLCDIKDIALEKAKKELSLDGIDATIFKVDLTWPHHIIMCFTL